MRRTILFKEKGGAGFIEIDNPPVNVLRTEELRELWTVLRRVKRRPIRGLLVRAAGRHFSAGTDVAEHLPGREGRRAGRVQKMLPLFRDTLLELMTLPIPTIVAVQGACLGGGFELVLCCDLVVAAKNARFGLPEIRLGCFPPVGAVLLPKRIGWPRAAELLYTGNTIGAREAYQRGIVNRVCPLSRLAGVSHRLLEDLLAFPRSALSAAKRAAQGAAPEAAQRAAPEGVGSAITRSVELYLKELGRSPEAREGCRAFLQKRPPRWR